MLSTKTQFSLFLSIFLCFVSLVENKGTFYNYRTRNRYFNNYNNYKTGKFLRNGSVRLVNGGSKYEGNVEILFNRKWGNICDDEWDINDAQVVCNQLGFSRAVAATTNSQFGPAQSNFWMDNLYCQGSEKALHKCRFNGWGDTDCNPDEAAGVICENGFDMPVPFQRHHNKDMLSNVQIRLKGGHTPDEGRVEVYMNNLGWGAICGDGWSLLEASVVCRQLGLGYATVASQYNNYEYHNYNYSYSYGYDYGKSEENHPVVMNRVKCRGNERFLHECVYEREGVCPGPEAYAAGVVCSRELADLVIDSEEISRSAVLEDKPMYFLQCAMEENCMASSAYKIKKDYPQSWHLETRRLLRFTAKITNIGTAPFKPFIPKHLWKYHMCHRHYHSMEVFATFDVLKNGRKVAEGHKASFCLEDNQCRYGTEPVFSCANYGDQGISPNCSDIYKHNIDCQWVDITDLEPGTYEFMVSVNPEFKVGEMSFDNNKVVCQLLYTGSYVRVENCATTRP